MYIFVDRLGFLSQVTKKMFNGVTQFTLSKGWQEHQSPNDQVKMISQRKLWKGKVDSLLPSSLCIDTFLVRGLGKGFLLT